MQFSLRNKLIAGYIVIALLPLLLVSILNYVSFRTALVKQQTEGLTAIAESKIEAIKDYVGSFRKEISVLQDNTVVKETLGTLTASQGKLDTSAVSALLQKLDAQFGSIYQKRDDIVDVMLVGNDGRIVYVSNAAHREEDVGSLLPDPDQATFLNAQKGVYVSDVFLNQVEDNLPFLLAAAPILDSQGTTLGLVVFEIDASELYATVQDTIGLGDTGETQLGMLFDENGAKKRDSAPESGDVAVFINPLRSNPGAAFTLQEVFGTEPLQPIQLAVSGKSGSGLALDYRNEEVLAVWRYIPSLNIGLVTKIDYAELTAPVNRLLMQFYFLIVVSFIFIGGFAWLTSGMVSRSVSEMEKARKLASDRLAEAERLNNVMVDRELKMVELKEELKKYRKES